MANANVTAGLLGVFFGVLVGYTFHQPIQNLLNTAGGIGFGKVGYSYQGCSCGKH